MSKAHLIHRYFKFRILTIKTQTLMLSQTKTNLLPNSNRIKCINKCSGCNLTSKDLWDPMVSSCITTTM